MDVATSRSQGSSRPRRRTRTDRARLRAAEGALGSLPRSTSGRLCSGDPLAPEELDELGGLAPEELLELVRQPRLAEAGEYQAPLKLVDTGRNPVEVAITPPSVLLHVYNLSSSVVAANSLLTLSVDGGVFHVGLEVYGSEFAYGVCGVSHLLPRAEEGHVYQCSLHLGETALTRAQFAGLLGDVCQRWSGADYDVLGCNCCCFCSHMLERLGVGPMPLWVDRISRLLLSGREAGREAVLASIQGLLQGGALVRHGLEALAESAQLALDGLDGALALSLGLEPEALACDAGGRRRGVQVASPLPVTRLGGA